MSSWQEVDTRRREATTRFVVITTINPKNDNISRFEAMEGWHVILVGDAKSPDIDNSESLTFLSLEDQAELPFEFVRECPTNHYARKNIGYLYAISQGARIIYDTDDDNCPYEDWSVPSFKTRNTLRCDGKFINIYRRFTERLVWPRGYPLDEIHCPSGYEDYESDVDLEIGVWQGLADIEPDVDAIFRLVFNEEISFDRNTSVAIPSQVFSPFNSQNTFWQEKAFQFLYLPATVSFRYTDILRGYIAQHLMWRRKLLLGFTHATVFQNRNVHNLLDDFQQEVECYTGVKRAIETMERLPDETGTETSEELLSVYKLLSAERLVSDSEVELCTQWADGVRMALQLREGPA